MNRRKRPWRPVCIFLLVILLLVLLYRTYATPAQRFFHSLHEGQRVEVVGGVIDLSGADKTPQTIHFSLLDGADFLALMEQGSYRRPLFRPADAATTGEHAPACWVNVTAGAESVWFCIGKDSSCLYWLDTEEWFRVSGGLTGEELYARLTEMVAAAALMEEG